MSPLVTKHRAAEHLKFVISQCQRNLPNQELLSQRKVKVHSEGYILSSLFVFLLFFFKGVPKGEKKKNLW